MEDYHSFVFAYFGGLNLGGFCMVLLFFFVSLGGSNLMSRFFVFSFVFGFFFQFFVSSTLNPVSQLGLDLRFCAAIKTPFQKKTFLILPRKEILFELFKMLRLCLTVVEIVKVVTPRAGWRSSFLKFCLFSAQLFPRCGASRDVLPCFIRTL